MRSLTDCCAPRPRATIAITAETPMTIPSMVRKERSRLALRASSATVMVSAKCMSAPSPARPGATAAATGGPRAPGQTAPHALGE